MANPIMILPENDAYYATALTAKRNTIQSAIDLVASIEPHLDDHELIVDNVS